MESLKKRSLISPNETQKKQINSQNKENEVKIKSSKKVIKMDLIVYLILSKNKNL